MVVKHEMTSRIGVLVNSAEPDQTPQNATSDQALHYLLNAEGSIKI